MNSLILKHANKNRLGAVDWGPNDFDVCDGDRCIGRIFLSVQAPLSRGFGQSVHANIRGQSTGPAIQRRASKR